MSGWTQFTREDVEIEYFDTPWGNPAARVTVTRPGSWCTGHRYGLRSAKGLEHATTPGHRQYLVDREYVDSESRLGDFIGSLGTEDLETAIDLLIKDLAKWDRDQVDRGSVARQLAELREALGEMDEWDPIRTDVTLRSRWPRARELFLRVEMALFEPPPAKVPDPPMWPWYSRVALFDVPSVDGRELRDGRYQLHNGAVMLMSPHRDRKLGNWIGSVDSLQGDGQGGLWAFGTVASKDMARQLIEGRLFASIRIEEEPEYELGDIFWRGGTVNNAVVLPSDQHPWGPGAVQQ